jgi:hypothetical protein
MKSRMESKMSPQVVIGVDIGKEVFHLVGFAADGRSPSAGGSGDWVSKMPFARVEGSMISTDPRMTSPDGERSFAEACLNSEVAS